MSDNIKVAIKVRPLIKREKDERSPIQWIVEENSILQIDPVTNRRSDAGFQFDYIFDMGRSNHDVFDATVKPIVEAAMLGFNGTIFAYGQTGSGKTYTMMGTKEERGVIPLAVDYIFNYIRNDPDREFLLRVSYIEIYNERINDLLDTNRTDLKVKEDYHGHISIDCKEEVTNSATCVLGAMRKGDKNRRTGETNMNDRSSRSHTIFRITIESCAKDDPDGTANEAQLNLIDLAGSERARQTGATGERFNEGRHINLSLSTLSLVIKQLSESQSFINFRDSKLTRILQPSLGGNAMTAIICAVTPAADDETQCTLAFAVRAKGIKNKPQVNENISDKALLKRIRTQKLTLEAEMANMKTEMAEKDKQILLGRIALMNMAILTSNSQNEEEFRVKARRRRTWAGTSSGGPNPSGKSFALPTIDECESKADTGVDELIQQRNIYEMDVLNQSFQTAFADFELQLIEDQREKNRLSNGSDGGFIASTITTRPLITIENVDSENIEICSPERSPVYHPSSSDPSPSTPKVKLREKIDILRSEFDKLREFTTLEKQLLQTDSVAAANQAAHEKNILFMSRSLADSEQMCKDLNKKYAELQSEHVILAEKYEASEQRSAMLFQEVQSLTSLRETLAALECEKNDCKSKMSTALVRQKTLEDESVSHTFEIDLLKKKHRTREKELEASLTLAWQEFTDINEKQKLTDIVNLHSVIAELKAKISSLESQLQSSGSEQCVSFTEDDFILKIDELDTSLKQSQAENSILKVKLSQTAECMRKNNEKQSENEFQAQIEEYTNRIQNLEQIIAQKDLELANNNNHELTLKLTESNDKLQFYENRIDEMKKDIENLQTDLDTKSKELGEMKLRLDVTSEESKKISDQTQLQLTTNREQLEAALSAIEIKEMEIQEMKQILQRCDEVETGTNQSTIIENKSENLVIENIQNDCDKMAVQLEEQNLEIVQLNKLIEDMKTNSACTIKSHQNKINDLLATNEKLRDQIANVQSERTMYDGDRTAMQTLLEEKDEQLQEIPKLNCQLEYLTTEKMELERIMNDQRTQLNEKILAMEKMHNYESEINNLNSYNENLQGFVKKLQDENEEMKRDMECQANSLRMLENEKKSLLNEFDSLKISLADAANTKEVSRPENIQNATLNEIKSTSRVCQVVKPLNMAESPSSTKKTKSMGRSVLDLSHGDKESSSIFANGSYFDTMDVSVAPSELIDASCTENFSDVDSTINDTTVAENKVELENSKLLLNLTCDDLEICLSEKDSRELISIVKELFNLKTTLEEENAKLAVNLRSKIQETVGIRKDFGAFKLDFEKLQQTILLLTTENSDMTGKLALEKEHSNEIQINLQKHIDELEKQIETIITEKQAQEMNIKMLQEKMENFKDSVEKINEEKIKDLSAEYERRIQVLMTENNELSSDLMDKIEKLDNIKDHNAQQCSDDCFRERWEDVAERAKILENENVDLSNRLMSKIEEFDALTEKYETLEKSSLTKSGLEELPTKIDALAHSVAELKILIAKLLDVKVMCQCTTQQTELNETRNAIKDNIEVLNARWHEFQSNFERARTEAEKLTIKAHEDNNTSIHETLMNSSVLENVDITIVEEKVQVLQSDFDILHDSLQRWSMLIEKTSDTEKLRDNNTSVLDISRHSPCESPRTSKRDAKIDRRQGELEKCKIEQQQLAKTINAFEKFKNNMTHMQHQIKILRAARETYEEKIKNAEESAETAQQRVIVLDENVTALRNQLDQSHQDKEKLDKLKLNLEEEIESLKCEKRNYEETSNELQQSLMEAKDSNVSLQNKLEELKTVLEEKIQDLTNSLHNSEKSNTILKSELDVIKSSPIPEREQVINLTSKLQKYKDHIETLETSVKELREKMSYYAKENTNLSERIAELQTPVNKSILNMSDNNMEVCDESFTQSSSKNKSIDELADARARITKEIATLQQTEVKNFDGESLSQLFTVFLTILMTKEQEIMKTLNDRHEKDKYKLIEKNKQSIDAEKRSTAWAKELEADIERLQNDIAKQETKNTTLIAQISKLDNLLLDSDHEKTLLKEKIAVMEVDFNALQTDYDKHSKSNSQSDDAHIASNEREKWLQQAIENHEIEHKARVIKIEDEYKKKIEELSNSLELSKTKNMDLKKELEALEANEQHLKSIIDQKISELTKSNSTVEHLQQELKELSEIYNQVNDDNHTKGQKIAEITALLKTKCDKMSEYKTQLETIKPEYEMLKVQATERQLRLEGYKSEMEKLNEENKRQIISLKDQLDLQEINSTALNKQLADITNRNIIVQAELEQMGNKLQEVQRENERLIKKMRNSTSKLTVEREMEELRDANRTHLKNLDGATNRIVELQKYKSQLMIEHADLQGRYDIAVRENNELKVVLAKSKIADDNKSELDDKYDTLLQEKNKIALELEEKRSMLIQLKTHCELLSNDNAKLQDKNVELDTEMDDIAQKIREMDVENTELQRKIYELENDNKDIYSNGKMAVINDSNLNQSILVRYENMKRELEVLTTTNELLKKENSELKHKIGNRIEGKSCGSSRSASPTPTTRSRQRRSDLFNQNRPLESAEDDVDVPPTDCRCDELRMQIWELEREMVLKRARIGSLQLQIRSEMFPYNEKCKELEDAMLEYQKRNKKLLAENNELRMKKVDCVRCTGWTLNRREESTQTLPEKAKIFLSGSSRSGIVEEHTTGLLQIAKLEKDKCMLKTKLKRRGEEKQKMQEQLEELQNRLEAYLSGASITDKNSKHVMKENVPANVTGQAKLIVPQRNWFN